MAAANMSHNPGAANRGIPHRIRSADAQGAGAGTRTFPSIPAWIVQRYGNDPAVVNTLETAVLTEVGMSSGLPVTLLKTTL